MSDIPPVALMRRDPIYRVRSLLPRLPASFSRYHHSRCIYAEGPDLSRPLPSPSGRSLFPPSFPSLPPPPLPHTPVSPILHILLAHSLPLIHIFLTPHPLPHSLASTLRMHIHTPMLIR